MNRPARGRTGVTLLALVLTACAVELGVPRHAKITCVADDDCPESLVCVEDVGICVRTDSPCITADGVTAANGTRCGDSLICVRGICAPPFCGDGVLDFAAGEQCDPGLDPTCRDSCVVPYCGDGLIDLGESCETTPDCAGCSVDCSRDRANCDLDAANGCECLPKTLLSGTAGNYFWTATTVDGSLYVSLVDSSVARFEVWRVPLNGDAPVQLANNLVHAAVTSAVGLVYVSMTDVAGNSAIARVDGDQLTHLYSQIGGRLGVIAADDEHVYVAADGIYFGDRETGEVRGQLTPVCGNSWFLQVCGADLLCFENGTFILWAIDRATGEARTLDTGPKLRGGCSPEGRPMWHDFTNLYVEGPGRTRHAVAALPGGQSDLTFQNEPIVLLDGDPVLTLYAQALPASYLVRRATRSTHGVSAGFAIGAEGAALVVFDLSDNTIKLISR